MKTYLQSTAVSVGGSTTPAAALWFAVLCLFLSACGALPEGSATAGFETAAGAGDGANAPAVLGSVQRKPVVDLPALRIGALQADSLDPARALSESELEIASLLYQPLVELDALARPVPGAAMSWSTWDNITWTFRLDPDGHFHNGELVTAESFIAGMMFLADPDNAVPNAYLGVDAGIEGFEEMARGDADTISGLVATETYTLVITLNEPNSLLPSILAHSAFAPRSAAALAEPESAAVSPVGNGAFLLGELWDGSSPVDLVPAGDGAFLVRFEFFDSVESMYKNGSLDVTHVPEHKMAEARDGADDDRVIERTAGAYNYISFPNVKPFDNPEIRRALSLAIDRGHLVDDVFGGSKVPADGFAPAGSMGSTPHDCASCNYDPDRARRLVAEAGGFGVEALELAFNTGHDHELWVQEVGAQWAEVFGIEVIFKSDGPAPYFESIKLGTMTGPYRLGWSTDYPHAMSFLAPLFVGENNNTAGYTSSAVTDAAGKLLRLDNPYDEQGSQMVSIMTNELDADMPIVPVYADVSMRVLSDAVSGIHLNLDGTVRLQDATLAN